MSEDRAREGRIGVTLTQAQRRNWLKLIRSENVGPVTFRSLVNHFGSAAQALDALPELARRGGARARIRIAGDAEVDAELAAAEAIGARFVALGEPDYPKYLRAIDGPPPLVAIRGGADPLLANGRLAPGFFDARLADRPTCAIVGARNASIAGRKFAGILARGAGEAGFIIVSGLARGIDAAAHEAALATGTIAVLAGGLDRLYPPEHAGLADAIVAGGGALLSEVPFGWEPRARDFPRRNRLISGISLGVVVVEAALKSGSLHTARFAGEQGRDVLAVPGSPLDPRAEGCNDLIRSGATLIARVDHLLETLNPLVGWEPPAQEAEEPGQWTTEGQLPDASATEKARRLILDALSATPTSTDEILRVTGVPAATLHLVLLELDLAGRLERHGHGKVGLVY
jgi:DNA processing protein